MSIFATWLLLAEDGDAAAPLVYRGSHVNPADSDPRAGLLEVAAIPNHCHPRVRDLDTAPDARVPAEAPPVEGLPVEYLRVAVAQSAGTFPGGLPGHATVIIDRAQVERLRDTLTEWLDTDER
ncbi:hypothetical protein DEJ51_01880 [Streptomyces venezuelae]|uniref:Uncharacterized protein n=1 Tax=Streptomyces venezuelae TaxID=54571 RepID=A0A5P2DDI9_STRVZ|nr:hypothetical protein [Streptomyces venezuelae]QES53156.1 hypothetical protein DEJ51_01880 [Streptomyces venezuelae]